MDVLRGKDIQSSFNTPTRKSQRNTQMTGGDDFLYIFFYSFPFLQARDDFFCIG